MAFDESVFGGGALEQIQADLASHYQPADGGPFSSDPSELQRRLARKLMQPSQYDDIEFLPPKPKAVAPAKQESAPDLSAFGDKVPEVSTDDLSSFGDPIKDAPPAAEPSKHWSITRGFVSGLLKENPEGLAETLEGVGHLAGKGDMQNALHQASKDVQGFSKLSPEEYAKKSGSMWDIRSIDDALTWAGETLGQGLASSVPSLATGVAGAVVGGRVGGKTGAAVGGTAGAALPSAVLNYGEVYKALKDEKVAPEQAAEYAAYAVGPMTMLDVASLGPIISRLGGIKEVQSQLARAIAKRVAVEAAKGAGREGLTEAAQDVIEKATVSLASGKPFWTEETAKSALENAVGGALVGGAMGGASGIKPDAVQSRSSPEEIEDFIRQTGGAEAQAAEEARARGAQTRSEIDEFLRQRDAREAASAPGLPSPSTGTEPEGSSSPTGTPPVSPQSTEGTAPASTEDTTGLASMGSSMADGISESLYDRLWPKVEAGDVTDLGRPDALLQAAKKVRDAGGLKTRDEFKALAQDYGNIERGADFQKNMRALVEKYSPKAEAADAAMQGLTDLFTGTRDQPIKAATAEDVEKAQPTEPKSDAQAQAENFQHAHVEIEHLGLSGRHSISIETGKGQIRKGTDPNGQPWEVKMPVAYGRIKGTRGADGQPLDIFVGPVPSSPHIFVVDQHHARGGGFDEHKIMVGFSGPDAAIRAYGDSYTDQGGDRIGHVTALTPDQFKDWLKGDTTQPLKKTLSENEIGSIFDELVSEQARMPAETDGAARGKKGGEPETRSNEKGSPQLPQAPSDGGPFAEPAGEESRDGDGEVRDGEVLSPDQLRTEPTDEQYSQIEAVLGADYHHVLPVDVVRAAEILAENPGTSPALAFQYAVIENAAQQQLLTFADLEQVYGPEVKAVLDTEPVDAHQGGSSVEGENSATQKTSGDDAAQAGELPSSGETGGPRQDIEQHDTERAKPDTKRKARDLANEADTGDQSTTRANGTEVGSTRADQTIKRGRAAANKANAKEAAREKERFAELSSKEMEAAIDKIEEAVEAGDRKGVVDAAGAARKVLTSVPQSIKDADPDYWKPFAGLISKMMKPGYVTAKQQHDRAMQAAPTWAEVLHKLPMIDERNRDTDLAFRLMASLTGGPVNKQKFDNLTAEQRHELLKLVSDPFHNPAMKKAEPTEETEPDNTGTERKPRTGIARPLLSQIEKIEPPAPSSGSLDQAFYDHFAKGEGFGNILAARRLAKDFNLANDPKAIEEAIEFAVVRRARDIIAAEEKPYPDLVKLYESQPRLGTRTSTSVRDQAYSTPVPLGYLAQRLAGVTKDTSVLEPTAGNGALLTAANPAKASVNEINSARADNLQAQGFRVSSKDASEGNLRHAGYPVDVVLANPPFGVVREGTESKVFDMSDIQPGYKTTEIDHAIALRSLAAMKDDGRAVLILGGLNKQLQSNEKRSDGYNGKAKREFYLTLYRNYNVTDHFTVAGELYERQGAGWPVDVVVINGRGKSARALPAVDVPRIYDSWESLGGLLDGQVSAANDGSAVRADGGAAREAGRGLEGDRPADRANARRRGTAGRNEADRTNGVRDEPVRGQPENERAGGAGDQVQGQPGADRRSNRSDQQPSAEQPASRLSADQIGDIFDELVDERSTGEVAASAAKNAASAADEALSGLTQLFGGGKTIGSGLNFDEDTYAKAKPMFIAASEKFADFRYDIRELMKRMLDHLKTAYSWTAETLKNAKPYIVRFIQDVQDGVVNLAAPAGKPTAKRQNNATETEGQVVYEPKSQTAGLDTLVPVNMRKSIADSLDELEARVGPIDEFVAKELGYDLAKLGDYFSAEQVDALGLAIDNLNKGKGFIIGDQTGIGKGRVNAAIIKWAMRKGRIPVFTTMMPDLYADIFRDMRDIGMDAPRILATNTGLSLPLDDAGTVTIKTGDAKKHAALLQKLSDPAEFKKHYDMVVTTYAQMQTVKGENTERRRFLQGIIPSATILFDESHNAGGQAAERKAKGSVAGRSDFARDLVKRANGVFYSSATYAKRPDVMDLYAATDMAMAVEKLEDLGEAIAKGGVPMQQVVAAMLAKSGQYIRRERSFAGINYNTPAASVDHEAYDAISYALAAIQDFSAHVREVTAAISQELKGEGESVGYDNATGEGGAHSTNFTSIMHNIINQMLLAMKVPAAAKLAIEHIQNGEKPVLTVANTMEAFLKDYTDALDIKIGDEIDADFSDVLMKYLERTREITIRKPFMKKGEKAEKHRLTDAELDGLPLEAYNNAKAQIASLDLAHLPVSPIDYLKAELQKAGYQVGEITGRSLIIDYTGKTPVLRSRPAGETSTKGKNDTRRKFNTHPENGGSDAIVINQSGSTGVSMHANKTFDDQRKRHMIIVQPEANIDTHMQLLGRVNRTGQVTLPEYDQLVADIPAEKRPASILAKKMASLNANTTAARDSAVTAKDVHDLMNQYGDQVAVNYIADNLELNERLALPLKPSEGGKLKPEDAMRKVTGRIPLLPLAEQEELWTYLEDEYAALIKQLEASGSSPLEAKTFDLKARRLETTEVQGPKNNSGSPFAAPVNIDKVSVLRQGKPFKPQEVVQMVARNLGLDDSFGASTEVEKLWQDLSHVPLVRAAREKEVAEREAKRKEFDAYVRPLIDKQETAKEQEAENAKYMALKERWTALHQLMPIGARVRLNMFDANPVAIVLGVKQTGKTKNPLALGSWKVDFAVADATRQMHIPFSRLFEQGKSDSNSQLDIEVVPTNENIKDTLNRFEMMQSGAREDRYIATGNLLAAYDWLNMKGAIINYTDEKGAVHQGIMTPKDFKVGDHAIKKGRIVADPVELKTLLDQFQTVWSKDRQANLSRADRWSPNYQIQVEKKKATGGRYYLDPDLTKLTGDFYSRGGMMTATVAEKDLAKAIERMQAIGAQFTVAAAAPKAQVIEHEGPPPDDEPPAGGTPLASREGVSDRSTGTPIPRFTSEAQRMRQQIEQRLRDIVQRVAGPGVDVEFHHGMIPVSRSPGYTSDTTPKAAGLYMLGEDLIRLAYLPAQWQMMDRSAYHESYHHLEARLQTEAERKLMEAETPRMREWIKGKTGLSDKQVDGLAGYEVRAIAFQLYAGARESGEKSGSGLHIIVRRWFDRLWEGLRALANSLRGLGFNTYNDIFEAAYEGKFAGRQMSETANIDPASMAARSDIFFKSSDESHDTSVEDVLGRRLLGKLSDLNLTEARAQLQDKFIRVKNAEQSVGAESSESAYQAESLYYGRTGYRLEKLNDSQIDPILREMKARDIDVESIDDFLSARHAPERNNKLGELYEPGHDFNRAIGDHDVVGASGWSTNEALGVIRAIKAKGKLADYLAVAKMVDALNLQTRRTLLNAGLIDQATFNAWGEQYKYYVPLRGFAEGSEHEESLRHQGAGMNIRGKEAKQAFGRKSRAASPLAYSIMQAEMAIVRAEKNRVGNIFLRFVREHPDRDRWAINEPKQFKRIDPNTGLVTTIPDNLMLQDDNVFTTKVNGRPVHITLKGLDGLNLARALKNMGSVNIHPLVRAYAAITHTMAKLSTAWNPEFMIPNFARDLGEAFINLQEQQQKGFVRSFMRHIKPSLEGSMLALAGKTPEPGTKMARYVEAFHRFDRAGGRVRFFGLNDPDEIETNAKRKLARLSGGPLNTLKDFGDKAAKAVEIAGGGIENATRLAAFMAAEDAGMSTPDAAMLARNLTVDFNKKGELGSAISALYMFANAGIQGVARMIRAMGHSKVQQAVGWLVFASMVATLYSLYAGGDDDSGTPNYMKIPEWERDKNLIVMTGKDSYVKIPLPYGFSMFAVLGSHAVTALHGVEKPGKAASAVMSSIVNAFNPLGEESSMLMDLVPSALRPAFHIWSNKNWTGRPLYPEPMPGKGTTPDSGQSFRTDSAFSKEAAKQLNAWSGGSAYQSGAIDVHPGSIDHMLQAFTGGVGRFAKGVVDTVISGASGEWQIEKTPIIRRFVGKVGAEADRSIYYEQRKEIRDQEAAIAAARKDRSAGINIDQANETLRDAGKVLRKKEIFDAADGRLRGLRRQEEKIEADNTLSDETKRNSLNELHQRMRQIQNEARAAVSRM